MPFDLIIPAAGSAQRMKASLPKQFKMLHGKMLLEHTILAFKAFNPASIVVALPESYLDQIQEMLSLLDLPIKCVVGGDTRKASVNLAMKVSSGASVTLIHDAARPCVSSNLIQRVLDKCQLAHCVIPAVELTDTVKQIKDGQVVKTLDRNSIKRIQTPQGFNTQLLQQALTLTNTNDVTDEALLIEKMGKTIEVVDGDQKNIKVTTPQDWELLNLYLFGDLQNN